MDKAYSCQSYDGFGSYNLRTDSSNNWDLAFGWGNHASVGYLTSLSSKTTDDLSEGSNNLYFTDARADARIAAASTDDVSEGSTNLYFTNARAIAIAEEQAIAMAIALG